METTATFVGTATVLLRLGSFTVLTDPNFLHAGQRAYLGYGMWSRRLTEPALQPPQLPALDAVVLSHLHGDHFDRIARHALPTTIPVLTTPPAARRLQRWGFEATTGLSTWQDVVLRHDDERLRITAVPARHGPTGVHLAMPRTMGTIVELEQGDVRKLRLYITGDTLFDRRMLQEIPERFPDIDAALVHLGGTRILGVLLTMNGRQGVQLVDLVRPRTVVPIHYDDYPVFRDPLSRFVESAGQAGHDDRIRVLSRGETVDLLGTGRPSTHAGRGQAVPGHQIPES